MYIQTKLILANACWRYIFFIILVLFTKKKIFAKVSKNECNQKQICIC